MKSKLLIMAALCAIGISAHAQTEKGKHFINGSIGFTSDKSVSNPNAISNSTTTNKTESFNIMPSFGYLVNNNLAIGLGVGYAESKRTNNSVVAISSSSSIYYVTQISKGQTFSVNPFLRKYVDIADKFKFFGQLNIPIGFGKGSIETIYSSVGGNSDNDYKYTTYGASLAPGFAFFPSKKWAIEFSFPLLSYNKLKPNKDSADVIPTAESFSFATSSFNPSIGFNFHF